MAKRKQRAQISKVGEREYDSLLLRSAESLGRMIGALQRQLDSVSRHLVDGDGDGNGDGNGASGGRTKPTQAGATKRAAKRKTGGKPPKSAAGARKAASGTRARKSSRAR
jgi:hypothetical protein